MTKLSRNTTNNTPPQQRSEILEGVQRGVLIGMALLALVLPPTGVASIHPARSVVQVVAQAHPVRLADFDGHAASADAAYIAHWVVDAGDNKKLPFVIVDKFDARVYVFTPEGRLQGASPILLGSRAGDDTVPGVGQKTIAEVQADERTTPAGRFLAEPGRNAHGEDVVWVDYDAAVSMHRVRVVDPAERRLERLATPTPADNRISYGCINVPVDFFENVLKPFFHKSYGMVYVLPEDRDLQAIFPAYDAQKRSQSSPLQTASR